MKTKNLALMLTLFSIFIFSTNLEATWQEKFKKAAPLLVGASAIGGIIGLAYSRIKIKQLEQKKRNLKREIKIKQALESIADPNTQKKLAAEIEDLKIKLASLDKQKKMYTVALIAAFAPFATTAAATITAYATKPTERVKEYQPKEEPHVVKEKPEPYITEKLDLPEFGTPEDKIAGSILASAIGDAQGRVTEFKNMNTMFSKYPQGVNSLQDIADAGDFRKAPNGKAMTIYTDDTQMAMDVLKTTLKARKKNWDVNTAMEDLANKFIVWVNSDLSGRAPGGGCKMGSRELERRKKDFEKREVLKKPDYWWACGGGDISGIIEGEGGCGSIMRAWSIGLVFKDDIAKVKEFAAAQSLLTHRNPLAVASSVALAVGVAHTINGKNPKDVVKEMIKAAKEYESVTSPNLEIKKMIESAADKKIPDAYFKKFHTPERPLTSEMIQEAYNTATSMSSDDKKQMIKNLKEKHQCHKFYNKHKGWAGDESAADAAFTFLLFPDDILTALYVGVHTPGDSDSIACMAGALVGARAGTKGLLGDNNLRYLESVKELIALAKKTAALHK
jgi:ADP-ribosylglycohydrolase